MSEELLMLAVLEQAFFDLEGGCPAVRADARRQDGRIMRGPPEDGPEVGLCPSTPSPGTAPHQRTGPSG